MRTPSRQTCADMPASELDLVLSCSHTKRCLQNAGITTLDQLMSLSKSDLLKIRGIGQVIANDVLKAQEQYAAENRQ